MVTLTVCQMKEALRIDVDETDHEDLLTRYLEAATATIDQHAPDAPASVANAAAEVFTRWLYDGHEGGYREYAHAFQSSGAAGLVAPWRAPRAHTV